jgi:hypothetical protein
VSLMRIDLEGDGCVCISVRGRWMYSALEGARIGTGISNAHVAVSVRSTEVATSPFY